MGGTKLLGVLVDGEGTVLVERRRPVPPLDAAAGGAPLVAVAAALAGALLADARERGTAPLAVGAGVPGLVTVDGRLQASPHLPQADGTDVRAGLVAALGPAVAVAVDNDATCAALAEWHLGAARGLGDVLVVTVGTGIGAGIVAGGRLLRGAHGFAGEVGHTVVTPDGPPCPCGRRGCWERLASGQALGDLGRRAAAAGEAPVVAALAGGDPGAVRGEHVTAAAGAGDPAARGLVAEVAGWLAIGIANLLAVLDTRRVVIGGGLVGAGATLIDPLADALRRPGVLGRGRPPVEVVPAALGPSAGAVGAALLARQLAAGEDRAVAGEWAEAVEQAAGGEQAAGEDRSGAAQQTGGGERHGRDRGRGR